MFEAIIWAGVTISLIGLAGLMWSILRVMRARHAYRDDDEALRAEIARALPINLGALFLSVIGLMMVMVGFFLA